MPADDSLLRDRFPRSAKYSREWLAESASGGANSLWLVEWLTEKLDLRPGMRVLDLGCGRAASSIFLRREFGVQVWATDLWFRATENLQRIRGADMEDGVFPLHSDARSLPFAAEFFDAILCIDSYFYFGTDDLYLLYLARLLKPGAPLAIAGAGLMREWEDQPPEHLRSWWTPELACLHSAPWWRRHWARSGIVDVELADELPEGWRYWLDWHLAIAPDNTVEIEALEADRGRHLGYVRAICRRKAEAKWDEPVVAISSQFEPRPLLRNPEGQQ